MPLTLREIASVVDAIAPSRLAYEWDNVGLQIGDPASSVEHLLVALEVDARVLKHAAKRGCKAILAHHPLIFQPQRAVRADDIVGRFEIELIRAGIGLVVAHTNLDRVMRGTNGALAAKMGLHDLRFFEAAPAGSDDFKFTVFVPKDHTPRIIEAIHRGGGGWIGNYSHCTFRAAGTGTYTPQQGAKPFQGKAGRLEQADEDRIEALVGRSALKSVLREVLAAHPYEEVAYDVYPLHQIEPRAGLGLIGTLPKPLFFADLAEQLRVSCDAAQVSLISAPKTRVARVAVITGSAGSSLRSFNPDEADALVTGELSYHYALEARERDIPVILLGHAASEKIFARFLRTELLKEKLIARSGLRISAFEEFPEPSIPLDTIRPSVRQRKAPR
jgi:dinuclear metal center YbgI/SA1388 family protein